MADQDWFAANAPKAGDDWFAANKPEPIAQPTTADLLAGRMLSHDAPEAPLKTMLREAAYPTSLSDFATYIVPSVGEQASPYFTSAMKQGWQDSRRLRDVPGQVLKTLYNRVTDTRTNPEIAQAGFNKLPLAQQMERLPTTGPMPTGRATMPVQPPQTPFNELPLYKQMEQLPETGPMPTSTRVQIPRVNGAPEAPTVADVRKTVGTVTRPQTEAEFAASGGPRGTPLKLKPIEAPSAPPTNVTETPVSQPLGQPRVMTLKPTPTSWTPEAARGRIEYNEWHTGAEPGSAEARSAHALHRDVGEMENRYRFLLDNPKAALLLGAPAAMRAALLSRWGGQSEQQ